MKSRILQACLLFAALLIFGASILAPGAQAQFVSFTQAAQHHGSAGIAGWGWGQDLPAVVNGGCSTGNTTCTIDFIATQPGSAWVIFIATGNNTHITSASGGSGTWNLCPSSECNAFNSGSGAVDAITNTTGTTGSQSVTVTLNAAATGFFGASFIETLRPPTATSSTFDTGGAQFTSSCTSCSGVALTTTATDAIVQYNDCANNASAWNGISAPYFLDTKQDPTYLNTSVGSIVAPTYTQTSGYCMFSAVAFKSNLGTFTPITPTPLFLLENMTYLSGGASTPCNPTCTVTIPSTAAGNLLFIHAANTGGATISSITDGGDTFTNCLTSGTSGANITITSTNDTLSCAYTLSVGGGKTTLSITMSGNSSTGFEVYEVTRTSGTWSLDTQGSTQRTGSGGYFTGQALTLTGSNDVIFQGEFNPGGVVGASLYPLAFVASSGGFLNNEAGSNILLNTTNGTAPIWGTNQNVASSVDAVAFQ
jgi:hypothetical protein